MKAGFNRPSIQAPSKNRAVGVRALHLSTHGPETPLHIVQNARARLQEEVVIEGLLHVTAVQAGSCLERFGSVDSTAAPALEPLTEALMDKTYSSSKVINEAICLATPPDPTETEQNTPVVRQAGRPGGASTTTNNVTGATGPRAVLREGATQLLQMEAQACQRTVMFNIYAAEVLQASETVRRQRRRALVRLLRAGRETARGLLQAPGDTLAAALASLDDGVGSNHG